MEEKVLIKSEFDIKAKRAFLRLIWSFLGIGIVALLLLFVPLERHNGKGSASGLNLIIESCNKADMILPYAFLISGCVFILLGFIFFLCYKPLTMCELVVTDRNVKGKTVGGKVVVLPLHQISTYSIKKRNSTIFVATSSGMAKFSLIGNYKEIGNVLSEMINKHLDKTETVASESQATSSNIDDLVKLKNLLDSGIITQEEFDIKKKQLLGL